MRRTRIYILFRAGGASKYRTEQQSSQLAFAAESRRDDIIQCSDQASINPSLFRLMDVFAAGTRTRPSFFELKSVSTN